MPDPVLPQACEDLYTRLPGDNPTARLRNESDFRLAYQVDPLRVRNTEGDDQNGA